MAGCATVNVPNIGEEGYSLADDERRLKKRADELCELLDESGFLYQNEVLQDYLNGLANRLLPPDVHKLGVNITIKVIRDPSLNAFALPNGRIYVHMGILATIENEDQLATLLAHEMTHIIHRHSLKQFRSITNKSAFFSTIRAPAVAFGGDLGSIFAAFTIISSVYGYSQELEREADEVGFQLILENGYDGRESHKIFEHMKKFTEDEDIKQPFFFSTHPRIVERIRNFKELIEEQNLSNLERTTHPLAHIEILRMMTLDNVGLCLSHGMFKTAEHHVDDYIKVYPDDHQGYFYRGELFRQRQDKRKGEKQRNKTEDFMIALGAFEKAIGINPGYAEVYKAKGRILEKQGKIEEAKSAFGKYLELNPQAPDREYVEKFLSRK